MPLPKPHDLHDFMKQISLEMAQEYTRIQKRASEDPGTAGDQGEENWAELLRQWLPQSYKVVTKGRIISQEGLTSPQLDILVVTDDYPTKLLNKKLYLAAGVAAAFECKTTLVAAHVAEAVKTCATVKALFSQREGSPRRELHSPIVYGLLAHSHSWQSPKSSPENAIERALWTADNDTVEHPRLQLDLLCVADFATWTSSTVTFVGPQQGIDWETMASIYGQNGSAVSSYLRHCRLDEPQVAHFTPIGVLVSNLAQKLAWEKPSLRSLADYYRMTNMSGNGRGRMRLWPSSIYSQSIRRKVEAGRLVNGVLWNEWSAGFQ